MSGPGSLSEPLETARLFVDAVAWGDHRRVWELLGPEGRKTVLRVAVNGGMDEALAARLRDGTAVAAESDEFLSDLINGLRADLQGNDLDALEYRPDPAPEPGRFRVGLAVRTHEVLAVDGLPVGMVELSQDDSGWRVERLVVPRS
ncbi:MAG: hypothetical protein ABIW46_09605 [Acidimicrobiales bacterium]